jgi:predicted PurR-regulated permease PerM
VTAPPSQRWSPNTKRIVVISMVVAFVALVWLARPVIAPLVLGSLIAFIVAPLVKLLHERARFPLWVAVVVSYVTLVVLLVLIFALGIPAFASSFSSIDWVALIDNLSTWAIDTLNSMRQLDLFGMSINLATVIDPIIDALEGAGGGGGGGGDVSVPVDFLGNLLGGALSATFGFLGFLVGAIAFLFLTIAIALYMTSAGPRLVSGLDDLFPPPHDVEPRLLGRRVKKVWTQYLLGQAAVAAAVGILTGVGLWAAGIPGAFFLGVLMFFFDFIPTFGPIVAAVPGVVVAITQGSTWIPLPNWIIALIVIGIYVVMQQVESIVLVPKVQGRAVSLPPLVVLISVVAMFGAFGVLGGLLAVPAVATGREVARFLWARLWDLEPFPEEVAAMELEMAEAAKPIPPEEPPIPAPPTVAVIRDE